MGFRGVSEMFQGMLSRYGFEVFPVRPTSHSHTEISTHHKINLNLTHRGEGGVSQHSISNIRTNAREGYGARLATSRSQVRVPAVQPEDRGFRETKQPPRRAKQQHTGLQACAALNRAHGPRSAEKSTLYGVIQFKFKLNQFKFKLISN